MEKTFAQKLKEARALTGLSQAKLSAAIGVNQRTYEGWERESRVPLAITQKAVLEDIKKIKHAPPKSLKENR